MLTPDKILTILTLKMPKDYTEKIIRVYENEFCPIKSTVDAIHVLNQVIERSYERNIDLHYNLPEF